MDTYQENNNNAGSSPEQAQSEMPQHGTMAGGSLGQADKGCPRTGDSCCNDSGAPTPQANIGARVDTSR